MKIRNSMTAKEIAEIIIKAFKEGHMLFLCGNGGSYDLAHHMEEEMICKFVHMRKPLPALALKAHTSTANDFGYKYIFSRQIMAYAKEGDVFIGISTSGKSENIFLARDAAKVCKLTVIDFPRKGKTTAKIQEYQLKLMHDICRTVEEAFI